MPLGEPLEIVGVLLRDGAEWVLRVDGGGRWRLDLLKQPRSLVGKPVRVRGVRGGFDLIDVDAVVAADQPFPLSWQERLRAPLKL